MLIRQPESADLDLAPCLFYNALQFEELPDIGLSVAVQKGLDLSSKLAHRSRDRDSGCSCIRLVELASQFQGPAIHMQQLPSARKDQNARLRAQGRTLHRRFRRGRFLSMPQV